MHFVTQGLFFGKLKAIIYLKKVKKMLSTLSKIIALFLYRKKVIDIKNIPVCKYGFEILISTLMGFLLVCLSGIICNEFFSAMIFYAIFVIVRFFTGGYHADTHFKCKATMFFCSFAVILISVIIEDIYSLWIHIFLLASYLISVILFAPIEHKNLPMTEEKRKRNRVISIVTSVLLTTVNMSGYYYFKKISLVSSLTLFVIAVLMIIPAIYDRRKMKNEQICKKGTYTQC